LQHPKELKSKSTAIHAKVLAPESVQIFEYPNIPDFINKNNSVLLYPGKNAITVPELVQKNKEQSTTSKIEYVVFIDSTWQQSKKIFRDEVVETLPCVKIADQKTLFWRYQQHGDSFLATIEAIYFFFREFSVDSEYNGEYDDLLYYYAHQYELIQERYRNDPTLTFNHKKGYINYEDDGETPNKKTKK
jgi:DTW domain-containing protein YfiP